MDDVFNVGNDKQTIRSIDDFWRVMADPDVALDMAVRTEEQYQQKSREEERRLRFDPAITSDEATRPAVLAASQASTATGRKWPAARGPPRGDPAYFSTAPM